MENHGEGEVWPFKPFLSDDELGEMLLVDRLDYVLNDARSCLKWTEDYRASFDWQDSQVPLKSLPDHPVVKRTSTASVVSSAIEEMKVNFIQNGLDTGDDTLVPLLDFIQYLDSIQKSESQDKLKQPRIRPILYPQPGETAFKHDPVQRYHDYKSEWQKCPPPGEKSHDKLRWKVRDYMTRVDLPQLK